MLQKTTFGIIGSGKMSEAIISGLISKKLVHPKNITATGPRQERGTELEKKYNIATAQNNLIAATRDIIILAVKPQVVNKILNELKEKISKKAIIISIIAGISLEKISTSLGCNQIVRSMPNTPGRINKGITVWTCDKQITRQNRRKIVLLLSALGEEVFVEEEKYLDMATALSGSGPAYSFLFMEALVDAGVRIGLPRYLSEKLVIETVIGSGQYAKESKNHLAQLRNDVTSPAGTSAEALYQLDKTGFRTAISEAVSAAHKRSLELGK